MDLERLGQTKSLFQSLFLTSGVLTLIFRFPNAFKEKVDYVGCLVSNLNRTDRELENLDLVEKLCDILKAISDNEEVKYRIQIYNQLNRLYQ